MFTVNTILRNGRNSEMTVWIEPWAKDFTLNCGESIQIESFAAHEGKLEIDFTTVEGHDAVVLHGFPGSWLRALQCEKVIWECFAALPEVP